jgi:Fe-S cluster assembly ATP-binding protein
MLSIKNLHASIDGKEILKGINLEVKAGEVHAIMGPNGSGKSTLSSVLAGREEYEVTAGAVSFDGKRHLGIKSGGQSKRRVIPCVSISSRNSRSEQHQLSENSHKRNSGI